MRSGRTEAGQQPVVVISDLHLDRWAHEPERQQEFTQFLGMVRQWQAHLIINGDIMDLPPSEGRMIELPARLLLERLAMLGVERNCQTRVTWIVGNHDIAFRGLPLQWKRLQVVYPKFEFSWGNKRVYIEHGHYYDPLFWGGYELLAGLRQVTGYDVGAWVKGLWTGMRQMGERVRQAVQPEHVVDRWQQATRDLQRRGPVEGRGCHGTNRPVGRSDAPAAVLRRWAAAATRLQQGGVADYVLFGHTHTPVPPRLGQAYVNTGDWVDHRTVTVFPPGAEPYQVEWDGEGSLEPLSSTC